MHYHTLNQHNYSELCQPFLFIFTVSLEYIYGTVHLNVSLDLKIS